MKVHRFEDLIVWQKAQDLAVAIYRHFNTSRDFSFKDQICRASVSISNNIAEGFDRYSRPDLLRFPSIALGSCSEVKSMLYLAVRLQYLTESQGEHLLGDYSEIGKMIQGLCKSRRSKPTANHPPNPHSQPTTH